MRISDYRQRLRDAFYERLNNLRGRIIWEVDDIKALFEQAGEQVILDELEEQEKEGEYWNV